MISMPSSRGLIVLIACLATITVLYRLSTTQWSHNHLHFEATLKSQFQHGKRIQSALPRPTNKVDHLEVDEISTGPLPNPYITQFASCTFTSNNETSAIRLPYPIFNISLAPPDSEMTSENQYFNPTFIPLPPHSPYPYLVLSRLVTAGLHQESHICLATLCLTQRQNTTKHPPLTPDAHLCDPSSEHNLSPHGGLRCATPPQKLNIPPTPAYRCENAWAAFPDIPGFHDPRVFWSGKGEPLVIINSASQYGCVGLWVVDLRAVYPELDDLLGRKGRYARTKRAEEGGEDGSDWKSELSARMSYPHLTELTRNPRGSRSAVEKNWILFFPRSEEAWVQYDIVAHGHGRGKEETHWNAQAHHIDLSLVAAMDGMVASAVNGNLSKGAISVNASVNAAGMVKREIDADKQTVYTDSHTNRSLNINFTIHKPPNTLEHTNRSSANHNPTHPTLRASRTLAKLIGSGYTTTNLTSPDESPCLTSAHLLDSLNNTGHWHQGSNSLRLILCARHDSNYLDHDDEALIGAGRIVHLAILHRKFSNALDLPMRYERYIVVWEARFPFRVLGISRFPVLFQGERMSPWADGGDEDGGEEAARWEGVYFTYTPSIAWAWRRGDAGGGGGGGDNGSLGTGYLGDDVLVGIGMDDIAQGFVRVKVDDLMSCLRLCPDFRVSGR